MSERTDETARSPEEGSALAEEAFIFGLPLVYIAVQTDMNTVCQTNGASGAAEPVRAFPPVARRV